MSKEQLIKILKAMSDNAFEMHKILKADRKWSQASYSIGESMALDNVIYMLTDEEFAANMIRIYQPDAEPA